jgi:hypothetical protein
MSVEETVRETLRELDEKKPCHACIFANESCTWCRENKIKIHPSMYGCRKHMTNEQQVRRLAEIEHEKHRRELAKLTLDFDIMGYAINAASIILEKIDNDIERHYDSIEHKTKDNVKSHDESKTNRDRLQKAYRQMKFHAMDMRNVYDRYIEYFFTYQFTDENGKYNPVESDKNLSNSGIVAKFVKLFIDRCLDNEKNGKLILDYILSLKGSGVYDEEDFDKVMIKN